MFYDEENVSMWPSIGMLGSESHRPIQKKVKVSQREDGEVDARQGEGNSEFFKARDEYYDILNQQEIYWKQKAKTFWLKDGDQNSKYFHAQASHRRKNNSITKLKDEEGV